MSPLNSEPRETWAFICTCGHGMLSEARRAKERVMAEFGAHEDEGHKPRLVDRAQYEETYGR